MLKILSFLNFWNAFRFYPLGASAWLFWVIFIDYLAVAGFANSGFEPLFFAFIVLLILALEQTQLFTSSHLGRFITLKVILLSCACVLGLGVWYFAKSFSELGSFLIIWNFMLACFGVFITLKIKSYEDFFANARNFVLTLSLLILWTALFWIFILSFEFLFFNCSTESNFVLWSVGLAIVGLIFLSKKTPKFGFHKRLNLLFLILNIFAWLYALMLLAYFILSFFAPSLAKYSTVHLVIWFGIFGLILVWFNLACEKKNFFNNTQGTRIFLAVLFALGFIALCAIAVRIHQYALTPYRTYIALLAIYLCAGAILTFYRNISKALWLFVFLAFLATGAIPLSINSQKTELRVLEDLKNRNYDREESILRFLDEFYGDKKEEIKIEPEEVGSQTDRRKENNSPGTEYHMINFPELIFIDVKGYDKLFSIKKTREVADNFRFSIEENVFMVEKLGKEGKFVMLLKISEFDKILKRMGENRQNEIKFKGELGYKFKLLVKSFGFEDTIRQNNETSSEITRILGKILVKEPENSNPKTKKRT